MSTTSYVRYFLDFIIILNYNQFFYLKEFASVKMFPFPFNLLVTMSKFTSKYVVTILPSLKYSLLIFSYKLQILIKLFNVYTTINQKSDNARRKVLLLNQVGTPVSEIGGWCSFVFENNSRIIDTQNDTVNIDRL